MKTHVLLSIRGATVDPVKVAEALRLTPKQSHGRGDPFKRAGVTKVHEDGFCGFSTSDVVPPDAGAEAHITWMVDRIEALGGLLASWKASGWRIQLDVLTVSERRAGGATVTGSTMRRLGNLELPMRWYTDYDPTLGG
jgi:hypothetical protein